MIRREIIAHLFLTVALFAALPQTTFAESTNRSPYNSRAVVDYDEIDDFEVKSFPLRMAHPYEIVIPSTTLGQVIACRIYNSEDIEASNLPETPGLTALFAEQPEGVAINRHRTSRNMQFVDSGDGKTHIFFTHKISAATFRCFNAHIEFKDQ